MADLLKTVLYIAIGYWIWSYFIAGGGGGGSNPQYYNQGQGYS